MSNTIYHFNRDTGEFINSSEGVIDLRTKKLRTPAFATTTPPPTIAANEVPVLVGNSWVVKKDFREEVWFDSSGEQVGIKDIGVQPDTDLGLVRTVPYGVAFSRARRAKINEVRAVALTRIQAILPAIKSIDEIQLIREQWLSIAPAARNPTVKFQALINLAKITQDAITVIKGLTNTNAVNAYSATNDPEWP